jgi:hypothetical protein
LEVEAFSSNIRESGHPFGSNMEYKNTTITNPEAQHGKIYDTKRDGRIKIVGHYERTAYNDDDGEAVGKNLIFTAKYLDVEGMPKSPINATEIDG